MGEWLAAIHLCRFPFQGNLRHPIAYSNAEVVTGLRCPDHRPDRFKRSIQPTLGADDLIWEAAVPRKVRLTCGDRVSGGTPRTTSTPDPSWEFTKSVQSALPGCPRSPLDALLNRRGDLGVTTGGRAEVAERGVARGVAHRRHQL